MSFFTLNNVYDDKCENSFTIQESFMLLICLSLTYQKCNIIYWNKWYEMEEIVRYAHTHQIDDFLVLFVVEFITLNIDKNSTIFNINFCYILLWSSDFNWISFMLLVFYGWTSLCYFCVSNRRSKYIYIFTFLMI